ncbi:MmgE/PrpD family protein [Streptomyces sp. NPDC050560]|uniref:MmgE/PrpD family protein n=1 Tax=Streptomyces sp. NPDC050560 TaxID=3365630 RepID=UPI0037B42858
MGNTLTELAAFAAGARYEDLPEAVVREARRTVLDSLGCALASSSVPKGRMCTALSRRLGGAPESSVIGVRGKVSPTSAALANGELINAMDYSALYGRGGHATPSVLPAILAVAEAVGASGRELILATAIGHELALRLSRGLSPIMTVEQHPDRPDELDYRWAPTYGFSRFNIAAAAGAGRLLGLDAERMAHALGLAGHHAQLPTNAKFAHSEPPAAMTKYGTAGWQSTGAVVSVFLAEMGYTGDVTLFESEIGFWRFSGSEKWDPEAVLDGLGDAWGYPELHYKPYPCCRLVQSSLDLFLRLRDEHGLKPGDIEAIRVTGHPYGAHPNSLNRDVTNTVDAQFSIPYIFSVAAHGVPVGPAWQAAATLSDPSVRAFMDRVTYEVHPAYRGPLPRDAQMSIGAVEVAARGATYRESTDYAYGTPVPGYEFTDEALAEKFRVNAAVVLPADKAERAVAAAFALDEADGVAELMEHVTPDAS